jgi:NADH-quinone oxidoreductase subunit A
VTQWRIGSGAAAAAAPAVATAATATKATAAKAVAATGYAAVGLPPAFRGLVFAEILVFMVVLVAAYAYAWRKGVFQWR